MTHKLIRTPNYLLVVDDSEIKERDYCLMFDDFGNLFLGDLPSQYLGDKSGHHLNKGLKKVIAHLQLNDSPILEGVDLLPPLEQEDDVEKLAKSAFTHPDFGKYKVGSIAYYNGYKEGYNKAKEKYKYTEEDINIMVNNAVVFAESNTHLSVGEYATQFKDFYDKCIQSLSQPKMPVAFECDVKSFEQEYRIPIREVRITTPEGHTQWVGKYIY